jgi:hypothetical protein
VRLYLNLERRVILERRDQHALGASRTAHAVDLESGGGEGERRERERETEGRRTQSHESSPSAGME